MPFASTISFHSVGPGQPAAWRAEVCHYPDGGNQNHGGNGGNDEHRLTPGSNSATAQVGGHVRVRGGDKSGFWTVQLDAWWSHSLSWDIPGKGCIPSRIKCIQ